MSAALMLLLVCVLVLAAWLVMHVALAVACARTASLSMRDRVLAVVLPPATPWVGWRAGHKRTVIAWSCLIVLYVAMRVALGAR